VRRVRSAIQSAVRQLGLLPASLRNRRRQDHEGTGAFDRELIGGERAKGIDAARVREITEALESVGQCWRKQTMQTSSSKTDLNCVCDAFQPWPSDPDAPQVRACHIPQCGRRRVVPAGGRDGVLERVRRWISAGGAAEVNDGERASSHKWNEWNEWNEWVVITPLGGRPLVDHRGFGINHP
jgi:hypothetical protein